VEVVERIEQAAKDGSNALDLSRMGLTEVPAEIGKLTQLRWLDLWGNPLSIPPEILEKWQDAPAILNTIKSQTAAPSAHKRG
jgi:Leucine-rich repeat (LRR) protein